MAENTTTNTQAEPEHSTEQQQPQHFPPAWHRLALAGILLISVFMNFYRLGQNGFDSYYPPAVRSMMDNWHNFLFAAYDPGGFTSLDKPPVGFWLQVVSAKLFGLTPFSVLLPQALAGVLSVLLLYYLVRRHFGETAGLLAALILALSPVSVVTNRNVTIDSTLALTMLIGAWAVLRAAETGRLRWLLLCAAIIGIGFNIKMLEAYLVIPAFGLLYLLAAPRRIWMRVSHLILASVLLLAISLSWVLVVDLTPASQRPHVGNTQNDSEISLALGYNGLQRLLGLGAMPANVGIINAKESGVPVYPVTSARLAGGPAGGNVGSIGGLETLAPLRLFTQPLAGQSGWLLPIAIFGMIALAWQRRPHLQSDRKLQSLILWGMWLLTMGVFFSIAGFIHEYYLTVMAPAIAALCGIGLVMMWRDYRRSGWRGWLLPLALIVVAVEQVYILTSYPEWGRWMIPLIIVLCALVVVVLLGARLALRFNIKVLGTRFLLPALAIGVIVLLLAPTLWAAIPILQGTESDLPLAGPMEENGIGSNAAVIFTNRKNGMGNNAAMIFASQKNGVDPALIRYLEDHQGNAQVLVATDSLTDDIILATNKPVMPLSGFSSYPLTTTELASLVAKGTLRFLLLGSFNIGQTPGSVQIGTMPGKVQSWQAGGGVYGLAIPPSNSSITTWATQHCKTVPASLWQSSSTGSLSQSQLYDCAASH